MKHEKKNKYNNEFLIINKLNINDYINNFVFIIDYNYFINDIRKSYNNNNNKIYKQFINDFNRCKIYINGNLELDYRVFNNFFDFLCIVNNYNIYDLYLLCTQAIMGFCLEIIYNNLNENEYIGELKKKKSLIYNIYSEKKEIIINVKKVLRIFEIDNNGLDKTLKKVVIKLYIPFNTKDKIIISYKILKNK